jgi:ABC-type Zn uptake system ZnuABC Zn-binding protein ZnuA
MDSRVLIACVALLLGGIALGQAGPEPAKVVVSIEPYGDLVRQLAADLASVEVIMPPGASPHTFELTPRMAAGLANADLVVLNGGVDEWLHDMVVAVNPDVRVVEALVTLEATLAAREPESGPGDAPGNTSAAHDHDGRNPHVWLDPSLAAEVLQEVGKVLAEVDPANRATYLERALVLGEELAALDTELALTLEPVAGAPFIPFHDAWPHFARRYGLDLVMEIEPFPGREPSPRYLAEVVSAIRRSGAPAIFNEVGLSDRPARVLAAEAGVEVHLLDPLGGTRESYQDMMRRNVATILDALGSWTGR